MPIDLMVMRVALMRKDTVLHSTSSRPALSTGLSRGPCWMWAYTDWLENRALSNVDDHRTDFSRLAEFA